MRKRDAWKCSYCIRWICFNSFNFYSRNLNYACVNIVLYYTFITHQNAAPTMAFIPCVLWLPHIFYKVNNVSQCAKCGCPVGLANIISCICTTWSNFFGIKYIWERRIIRITKLSASKCPVHGLTCIQNRKMVFSRSISNGFSCKDIIYTSTPVG